MYRFSLKLLSYHGDKNSLPVNICDALRDLVSFWFTEQASIALEIGDNANLTLVIG